MPYTPSARAKKVRSYCADIAITVHAIEAIRARTVYTDADYPLIDAIACALRISIDSALADAHTLTTDGGRS